MNFGRGGSRPNILAQIGEVVRRLIEEVEHTVPLDEQKLPLRENIRIDLRFWVEVAEGEIEGLTDEMIKKHLTV